jgi:tRNA(Arg) A34 adenosine deaminase TadA
MRTALAEAEAAAAMGEIPVGAVIVHEGRVIARAHNTNRSEQNALRHAEIIAIEAASRARGNERLNGCDLYVTKEPCAMCAGAIVHARIRRLIIGTEDIKYGACGTVLSVCGNPLLNHMPQIEFGLLREASQALLKQFFEKLRKHE